MKDGQEGSLGEEHQGTGTSTQGQRREHARCSTNSKAVSSTGAESKAGQWGKGAEHTEPRGHERPHWEEPTAGPEEKQSHILNKRITPTACREQIRVGGGKDGSRKTNLEGC